MSGIALRLAPGSLVALTDQCVQCGLCLPACPTYAFERIESESPRGRIALIRAWELEQFEPTPMGDAHVDHCLGCRRCEAVCPAGVQYGPLLALARGRQRARRIPGWRQRGIEWLAARRALLGTVLALYRAAYPLLPPRLRPLPPPPVLRGFSRRTRPEGAVAVFAGCLARSYEEPLRQALERLCAAVDVPTAVPVAQGCCGSLHAHAGHGAQARALASANRTAFAGAGTVLTLASGCHEALAEALDGTAEVVDAVEFLASRSEALSFRQARERIALHIPCTQRNVVRSHAATRRLLGRVPGLDIVELDAGFGCCGAAGSQMLLDPGRAASYRQPLLDQLAASGATRLLSSNIGCRLHFANGARVLVQHPIDFLAEYLQ